MMEEGLNVLRQQSRHGDEPPPPPPFIRLPFVGRIRFLHDREGLTCVGITALYWLYGSFATFFLILLPQYREGVISCGFIIVYSSVSLGTIVSLWRAATLNPGRVPPVSEIGNKPGWIACHVCSKPRPPKAHHCRRCQQCVLRMDHHCPWINNCVGEDNHYMFFLLCFFAFLLGLLTFILCMLHFWVYPKCQLCDTESFFVKHSLWFLYLLTAMGAVMAGVMFSMIAGQHINLILDRTTLDHMQNPHQDPNELTMRNWYLSYKELCGGGSMIFWLFPCRNRPYRTVYLNPV